MTSVPRDPRATKLAWELRRKRYTLAAIAERLVAEKFMPSCSVESARKYCAEGERAENAAIAAEIEDDPYGEPARDFILERMRARVAQVRELEEITTEAWELIRQHPDKTIIDISPTLKWVAEVRARLLGTDVETQSPGALPPAPDRDMERRVMAAGDPGV